MLDTPRLRSDDSSNTVEKGLSTRPRARQLGVRWTNVDGLERAHGLGRAVAETLPSEPRDDAPARVVRRERPQGGSRAEDGTVYVTGVAYEDAPGA
jgi:hypothetical protein